MNIKETLTIVAAAAVAALLGAVLLFGSNSASAAPSLRDPIDIEQMRTVFDRERGTDRDEAASPVGTPGMGEQLVILDLDRGTSHATEETAHDDGYICPLTGWSAN